MITIPENIHDVFAFLEEETGVKSDCVDLVISRFKAGLSREGRSPFFGERYVEHCLREAGKAIHLIEHKKEFFFALLCQKFFLSANGIQSIQEKSAYLATLESFRLSLRQELSEERTRSYIQMTDHTTEPRTLDESLMADIDLAIVGFNDDEFDAYTESLSDDLEERKKFREDEGYLDLKKKALRRFNQEGRVYHSDFFAGKYEKQARINILKSHES